MVREQLEEKLRSTWNNAHGRNRRQITLPRDWKVSGDETKLRIELDEPAVISNMQEDAGAFEAFVLAVRVWLDVERLELDWPRVLTEQDPAERTKQLLHLRRFEYR